MLWQIKRALEAMETYENTQQRHAAQLAEHVTQSERQAHFISELERERVMARERVAELEQQLKV